MHHPIAVGKGVDAAAGVVLGVVGKHVAAALGLCGLAKAIGGKVDFCAAVGVSQRR